MSCETRIFGVRHHGPGSARQVRAALEAFAPEEVLIEGPSDLSEQIHVLAHPDAVMPIALVAHPDKNPEKAVFWPFSDYAPERIAALWAIENNVPVRFIDLPVCASLTYKEEEMSRLMAQNPNQNDTNPIKEHNDWTLFAQRDPIGALAQAAGYADGESWWSNVIEENPNPEPVFESVASAMSTLREDEGELSLREAAREAHMRLEIKKSEKNSAKLAVICGAWHVPALQKNIPQTQDKAVLKGMSRTKSHAAWTPWSEPRLAQSTYGAGVASPGWCAHVWNTTPEERVGIWMAKLTQALRDNGKIVSTASVIEAHRLAQGLSILRERPAPGLDEIKDAAISVLTDGSELAYDTAAHDLLMGTQIGEVPENAGQPPLLEDLQRQQKATRLKPSVAPKSLQLDLRKDLDKARSTLLHRLTTLGVAWGKMTGQKGRGTFREDWTLSWAPEMTIALVDNQVLGASIETAATQKLRLEVSETESVRVLASCLSKSFAGDLPLVSDDALTRLAHQSSQNEGIEDLLGAMPEMANAIQYGSARGVDTPRLSLAFDTIALQAALALPLSARDVEIEFAKTIGQHLEDAVRAVQLLRTTLDEDWHFALSSVAKDEKASPWLAGLCARLLLFSGLWTEADAQLFLSFRLSPSTDGMAAALVFEGFFKGQARRLSYDESLRDTVSQWLVSLNEDAFVEHLPAVRRGLEELTPTERSDILDGILGRASNASALFQRPENWDSAFTNLTHILKGQLS